MLRQIADGVFVRESAFCQSNAVVVRGEHGVLLVDAGVHGHELATLADELGEMGETVAVGFSTHPHWDHLLWHVRLGSAPRYGTARCCSVAHARRDDAREKAARIAEQVPLDQLGMITPVPSPAGNISWDGPEVRIIEHQAHAPGHAALLIADRGVLVAGDMLSDVEIPLFDLTGAVDPVTDHLQALDEFEDVADDIDVVVPGHGMVGNRTQLRQRIDHDRAYCLVLRDGRRPDDARVGPSASYGRDWLPGEHERQLRHLLGNDS